jgi:hypothetical protein
VPYPQVVHERSTSRGFLNTLRDCRLYDCENHRWLDFDGTPTSEVHPMAKPAANSSRASLGHATGAQSAVSQASCRQVDP